MTRRGIVLAGGSNSRLYPATLSVPKSLLPVYDKPLIYYSLSVLMLAGIREILVIVTPEGEAPHRRLLGDGGDWGLRFEYLVQDRPRGIADAFRIGRDFIDNRPSALILADNIYYGSGLRGHLNAAAAREEGSTVFTYSVPDPERFGVAELDSQGQVRSLEEKPQKPRSRHAVTGCYFYDSRACQFADELQPSARGELEITDLNKIYLQRGDLFAESLGRGVAWFDTGTPDSLSEAGDFVQAIQKRQGLLVSSPEEIAYHQGWLDGAALKARAEGLKNTFYGDYLRHLASEK